VSVGGRLFAVLQYALPKRAITALVYRLARARTPWLRRALIGGFSRLYALDLSEAADPDPGAYRSFNDFFTRALRAGARPLAPSPGALASPCDGTVSECGTLDGERLLQARLRAKSRWYTLGELLGDDGAAAEFVGGEFATIYLAPYNYHRVHMPLDGTLTAVRYLPGQLFSVNRATAAAVPRLFARNERVVCRFATAAGPLAVVFVGALNVGSITIEGYGEVTPRPARRACALPVATPAPQFARGAELGRFNMGSTVIVLMPRGACRWAPGVRAGAPVRMGAALAELSGAAQP
jgi:phosphatidylserine decarboxylase